MALKQSTPQNKPSEPVSVFRQNIKVEGFKQGDAFTRENLRKMGLAFLDALETTFVTYLENAQMKKLENPNLEAIKKTVADVQSYSQVLSNKFQEMIKTPPAPPPPVKK